MAEPDAVPAPPPLRRRLDRLLQTQPLEWSAALGLGALAALAFAPHYLVVLLAIGLSGLVWLIGRARSPGRAFFLGWWFGLGHFAVGFAWITESFANQPATPDALGPPAVLALAAGMALYPGLACWATRKLGYRGLAGLVVFAAAWTAAEWLRGHLLTGFPWNPIAAAWAAWPAMLQPLALLGSYGLGFFTVLVAAAPALLLPPLGSWRAWPLPVAAVVLLGLWGGWGALRLAEHPPSANADVTVRLVQANIPQAQKWRDELRRKHFADYLSLSGTLAPPEGRLIVVWPETAVTDYRFDQRPGRRALAARMLPENGYLVTGAPRVTESQTGRPQPANSLFVIDSTGRIAGQYDKHHLVPFGEYLPLRGMLGRLGLDKLVPGAADFHAGHGLRTLQVPGLPAFSPLICYEAIFAGAVARDDARPEALVNITNDAWFGSDSGPYQHFAQARMRSVEEGLPLVRAAQTGISAVMDPVGRIETRIPLLTRGAADTALPEPLPKATAYARWGDMPAGLLLFFTIAITIFTRERVVRARTDDIN